MIIPPKDACKLILFFSGIMSLLGLAWVLSLFTAVGADTNRNAAFTLQWMFVFFNSLQGFFVFLFFVVLSADARDSWLTVMRLCCKSTNEHYLKYTTKTSSTVKETTLSISDSRYASVTPLTSSTVKETTLSSSDSQYAFVTPLTSSTVKETTLEQ